MIYYKPILSVDFYWLMVNIDFSNEMYFLIDKIMFSHYYIYIYITMLSLFIMFFYA